MGIETLQMGIHRIVGKDTCSSSMQMQPIEGDFWLLWDDFQNTIDIHHISKRSLGDQILWEGAIVDQKLVEKGRNQGRKRQIAGK